jgi:hypothetical protein
MQMDTSRICMQLCKQPGRLVTLPCRMAIWTRSFRDSDVSVLSWCLSTAACSRSARLSAVRR